MATGNIPDWLESIKPPKFCEHRVDETSDDRIKLAVIPSLAVQEVADISAGKTQDLFKEFRRRWHKKKTNVIIHGPAGTGKTTIAAWACINAIKSGGFVEWLQAYKMGSYLVERKNCDPRRTLYHAERAPLCVIDDAHKIRGTWTNERQQLSGIIHLRHAVQLPTIICSVASKDELSEEPHGYSGGMLGPDTMDRFQWVYKTEGESLR